MPTGVCSRLKRRRSEPSGYALPGPVAVYSCCRRVRHATLGVQKNFKTRLAFNSAGAGLKIQKLRMPLKPFTFGGVSDLSRLLALHLGLVSNR